MQKREKVTEAFLRLALHPLKVDADTADDDGQALKSSAARWHSGAKHKICSPEHGDAHDM